MHSHKEETVTYREQKEARLAKREEWAVAREQDAAQHFRAADPSEAATGIPFGQPILVGHHSEGRHRRALSRLDAHMSKACESTKMAEHHTSTAAGIRHQRVAVADNAGGVNVEYFDGHTPREWCRVTFAEKPPREMLNALRAAGFRWGAGSWTGRADALPPNLTPE